MMTTGKEVTKLNDAMRASTPSSGFSVRQSEEAITSLRKENFNLKLKIFLLESQEGCSAVVPFKVNELGEQEYLDMFMENESMRFELEEKQTLLKSALDVIQNLEDQKLSFEQKCQKMMVEQQIQTIKLMKAETKRIRRKKSKVKCAPQKEDNSFRDFELVTLRADNKELIAHIVELEKEIKENIRKIFALSDDKLKLEKKLKLSEERLNDAETNLAKLTGIKRKKPSSVDSSQKDNELVKRTSVDWSEKCAKLERDGQDLERIVNEQSALMKALNRAIEAKNEQLIAYKNRIDLSQVSSSTSDPFCPEDFCLTVDRLSKSSSSSSEYPFHNPLYGKEYESIYR